MCITRSIDNALWNIRPPAPDDPFPNPDKESRNPWAHLNRPKSRDFIIDQSSAPKRPVFANATRDNCLWIRGRVFCSNSANEHNGRTAVAYFVDSSKGRIDETYTSKNGLFSVFGCSPHSFATSDNRIFDSQA
uniref:Uncharacterized protein n=1 Tax=Romanomermis culicivorax TaxID=13658 RepID=A0A915JUP8_ROMCU